MKATTKILLLLGIFLSFSCNSPNEPDEPFLTDQVSSLDKGLWPDRINNEVTKKATGFVEIQFQGGQKGGSGGSGGSGGGCDGGDGGCEDHSLLCGDDGGDDECEGGGSGGSGGSGGNNVTKYAYVKFIAFKLPKDQPGYGDFVLKIINEDYMQLREIGVTIDRVCTTIEGDKEKVGFVGHVVYDTKGCSGNGNGGHGSGCQGGACAGGGHDGGCEDGGDDGEGGCDDHGLSCSEDGGDDGCEDGGSGGSGGNNGGSQCRVGQILVLKCHDSFDQDGLTWKWYDPEKFTGEEDNMTTWPHLCKKTILSGDIRVENIYRF